MFFKDSLIKSEMSLINRMIYEGAAFRSFLLFEVPPESDFTVSILNGPNAVHLFSRLVKASMPNMIYEVRTGATVTNYGANVPIFNMNAYSQRESANIARICTVSDIGDLTDQMPLAGHEEAGNRFVGEESLEADDLKVLPNDVEFIVRVTNPNTQPAVGFIYLKWFETRVPA